MKSEETEEDKQKIFTEGITGTLSYTCCHFLTSQATDFPLRQFAAEMDNDTETPGIIARQRSDRKTSHLTFRLGFKPVHSFTVIVGQVTVTTLMEGGREGSKERGREGGKGGHGSRLVST